MSEKANIAVDFDGVIHQYISGWMGEDVIPDPPVEGMIDWLNEIAAYYDVIIFTTRAKSSEGREAVHDWLVKNGCKVMPWITHEKPPALLYLDDRGWQFDGTPPTLEQIKEFRPWNKKGGD